MIGQKFNRWTIVAESEVKLNKRTTYLCRCDCGTEKLQQGSMVKHGHTKSCGCFNREQSSKKHRQHGLSLTPIYGVWKNMMKRCNYIGSKDYYLYGGRGIAVCERWHTFQNFYDDMGDIPFPHAQLDRMDVNGDYENRNCKWATPAENQHNRRDNRLLTYRGETLCLGEWEQKTGFPRNMLHSRLSRGWTMERAVETPPMMRGGAMKAGYVQSKGSCQVML